MTRLLLVLTSTFLSTTLLPGQTITVRDKITALPPVSICQDGATHKTLITNHRLRPGKFKLDQLPGKPIEVSGTPRKVTCKFLDVTAVKVLKYDQRSVASKTATQLKVEFYGTPGGIYALYIGGLNKAPFRLPGIDGPIHLNPNLFVSAGVYAPLSTTQPYATLTAPTTPTALGVDFFNQAVAINVPAFAPMTNVDRFRF